MNSEWGMGNGEWGMGRDTINRVCGEWGVGNCELLILFFENFFTLADSCGIFVL
ncbi:MAG: hypothetical protein KME64_34950 [Scytonematopsis contorta HA4267-MV1]|jgi:hypothetical protein|nr:hypothetical protein [Scytonematopsis contorta HA4267-MV1]